ncbi:MAG: acetate--CoA ligase family protein [Sandaracinaceae bacterium]
MSARWLIVCDDAELAVECARVAATLGIETEPAIDPRPVSRARSAVLDAAPVAVAMASPPSFEELVTLADASREVGRAVPLAVICDPYASRRARLFAGDLGLPAVDEVEPLLSAIALLDTGADHPWTASTRALTALDRARLGDATLGGRGGGHLGRADGGMLSWALQQKGDERPIGAPRAVGDALRALRAASEATEPARAVIEGADRRAVHDVIFGPPRALSDPASKSALAPYGVPLPIEELCSSPSRAASEAARIGFPVRISLASPDIRIWDHPDMSVDDVDNAARVRDVYRQIMTLANERQPDARLLGVLVTATSTPQALLRVSAEPLAEDRILAEIAFADPHGRASRDGTLTVLPADPAAIERVLGRLDGADLVLGGGLAHRKTTVAAIADALVRLAAFVNDHRREVERVELNPLALLVGGAMEVREACVTVGDAFLRGLETARPYEQR